MKIVFHVNEISRWDMALNNIHNILAIDNTLTIELLLHGKAVVCITNAQINKAAHLTVLNALNDQHVVFAVCNHTLSSMNMSKADIYEKAIIVPAGIYELAKKQEEGYCYIKP